VTRSPLPNIHLERDDLHREEDVAALGTNLLRVSGVLTCGGTLNVTNLTSALAQGDSFKLFDAATVSNAFTTNQLPPLKQRIGLGVHANKWNDSRRCRNRHQSNQYHGTRSQ
jgi:hypothetical protein